MRFTPKIPLTKLAVVGAPEHGTTQSVINNLKTLGFKPRLIEPSHLVKGGVPPSMAAVVVMETASGSSAKQIISNWGKKSGNTCVLLSRSTSLDTIREVVIKAGLLTVTEFRLKSPALFPVRRDWIRHCMVKVPDITRAELRGVCAGFSIPDCSKELSKIRQQDRKLANDNTPTRVVAPGVTTADMAIPRRPQNPGSSKLDDFAGMLGKSPDELVGKRAGVTTSAVNQHRKRRRIPSMADRVALFAVWNPLKEDSSLSEETGVHLEFVEAFRDEIRVVCKRKGTAAPASATWGEVMPNAWGTPEKVPEVDPDKVIDALPPEPKTGTPLFDGIREDDVDFVARYGLDEPKKKKKEKIERVSVKDAVPEPKKKKQQTAEEMLIECIDDLRLALEAVGADGITLDVYKAEVNIRRPPKKELPSITLLKFVL